MESEKQTRRPVEAIHTGEPLGPWKMGGGVISAWVLSGYIYYTQKNTLCVKIQKSYCS